MPGIGLDRRRLPAAALAAGALLFALGLALACTRLPEWRVGTLAGQGALREKFVDISVRSGFHYLERGPRLELCELSRRKRLRQEVPITSVVPDATLAIRVGQKVFSLGPSRAYAEELRVWFDSAGRPKGIEAKPWGTRAALAFLELSAARGPGRWQSLAAALAGPGESLGQPVYFFRAGFPLYVFPIAGSAPPQHVTAMELSAITAASRNPGDVRSIPSRGGSIDYFAGWHEVFPLQMVMALIAGAFCYLAIRRRLGLANAGWLATVATLAVLPEALNQPSFESLAGAAGGLLLRGLWLAVLWSAAESLWRTADLRFDPTLDLLRARRLTARTGRALLAGVGLGAAAAGVSLAVHALATWLPGVHVHALTLDLPVVDAADGPLSAGITCAAVIAFLLAAARRLSAPPGRRWVAVVAALVAAGVLAPVKLDPWPVALAGGFLVAGLLAAAAELGGITTLLAASLAFRLLPAAAFSTLHLSWLPGSFALAAGGMALLVAIGAAGARRGPGGADEAPRQPAFMQRLEQERRLEVEMDLLARMQRGLLPSQPPAVAGWEIAARSLLASRAGGDLYDFLPGGAGRLWIAAGDVAGHGYSCAVDQAMVKAALGLLAGEGRTPSEVLSEIDRVLRTTGASRAFTSLALLRLDPSSGEALLANAGHPFPLLAAPGQATREVALPGLPLGQGPPRQYADLPLALPPGATLVLCSDGLFEATAGGRELGAPYGYDRPRLLLDQLAGRPAAEVLDRLLDDWRRHLGSAPQPDDTSVVVLRRLPP
jgi:hypothetical protein